MEIVEHVDIQDKNGEAKDDVDYPNCAVLGAIIDIWIVDWYLAEYIEHWHEQVSRQDQPSCDNLLPQASK